MEEDMMTLDKNQPSLKNKVDEALGLTPDTPTASSKAGEVSIAEARAHKPLRTVTTSDRTNVRMLFVTSDPDALVVGSATQQHYADLAQFVGELHLMVLHTARGEVTVERPMRNVWVYRVPGRHSWQQVWRARRTALSHLRFNGVVQPDVLVATDPFTAGVVTWLLARALKRPWQLHLRRNYFSVGWLGEAKANKRKLRWGRFVLRRAASIRTATESLAVAIRTQVSKEVEVEALPRFFNLEMYRRQQKDTLHEQYHQHRFIVMAEGAYQADSALHDVFAAVHTLLQQGQVALLIRGTGRAKQLFTEKAELLGVRKQVIFESTDPDPVSRYQGADIFIETDTTAAGDERVLRAIASSTPVVAYRNEFRADIVVDGESGFLCEAGDSYALGQKVRTLYNDSARRQQFAMRARNIAEDQLHEDVSTYYMALRDTVSAALVQAE